MPAGRRRGTGGHGGPFDRVAALVTMAYGRRPSAT
jgi:hypothetical protein